MNLWDILKAIQNLNQHDMFSFLIYMDTICAGESPFNDQLKKSFDKQDPEMAKNDTAFTIIYCWLTAFHNDIPAKDFLPTINRIIENTNRKKS